MNTPRDTSFQKRAALRKSSAEQAPLPETMGDTSGPDTASLLFTGAPEEGAAQAGTKLASVLADHAQYFVKNVKPLLSQSAWEKFMAILAKGGR